MKTLLLCIIVVCAGCARMAVVSDLFSSPEAEVLLDAESGLQYIDIDDGRFYFAPEDQS